METIGDRIKYLRVNKKITQDDLAKRLGVTRAIISAYENKIRQPSLNNLISLSNVFNVSADYLLGIKSKKIVEDSNEKRLKITGLELGEVIALQKFIEEIVKNRR